MKNQDATELQWVGVDLHVHTPASRDYRGSRDKSEFLAIIKKANEFGAAVKTKNKKKEDTSGSNQNPIQCIAFTDHNSVEGFRSLKNLQEETESLSRLIRERDASNPLAAQLEEDRKTLRSCRVLMGVEIKADPGIHLLTIFDESTPIEDVTQFLSEAYGVPYQDLAGDPTPTAKWTVRDTLERIHLKFQDLAFVIFPHVDSSGGVYEHLKDFPQVRIGALTHPIVRALSFNKVETREKLTDLLSKPEYRRTTPIAFIQSSDYHGESGTAIGQPRAEVNVREGKPTFKNIKEAFRERRVKCSVDFVEEEYSRLTEGQYVRRFQSLSNEFGFKETDHEEIAWSACAMLNCSGGIIELEGLPGGSVSDEDLTTTTKQKLMAICEKRLDPVFVPNAFRVFRISATRARVLCRVFAARELYSVEGRVFLAKSDKCEIAKSHEIEAQASSKVAKRYGKRFETALGQVAEQSKLLSRLPKAIPLLLGNQTKLTEGIPDSIKIVSASQTDGGNTEVREFVDDLEEKQREIYPFGNPHGNCTIMTTGDSFRRRDHYMRFTAFRGQVGSEILAKYSWPMIESPTLAVEVTGFIGLVEPGFLISDAPMLLIKLADEWLPDVLGLLAWFKSSFFLWFSAVCYGEDNPYFPFRFRPTKIPIPSRQDMAFVTNLGLLAKKLIEKEREFMEEVNRAQKKGDLDAPYREKLRSRHNATGNALCLQIDKEIYSYLGVSKELQFSVGRTLRDLNISDFGLLEELEVAD